MRSRCGTATRSTSCRIAARANATTSGRTTWHTGTSRQVTQFNDFDITFPSLGPDAIVFQAGGRLYLLDVPSEKATEVPVRVVTDETTLRPRTAKAERADRSARRCRRRGSARVFEARGDVVDRAGGVRRGASTSRASSGVAERYPRWSPDGKTLAYWSDRSGEYELTVRPADGAGAERKVTSLGAGFRYAPHWSPDSRKIAFVDQAMRIRDRRRRRSARSTKIDESPELDRPRRPRSVPVSVVAGFALARATHGRPADRQQRRFPLRHEGRASSTR